MSLQEMSPAEILGFFLACIICIGVALGLLKRPAPPQRDEQLHARHRRIRDQQLGDGGYALPQVLWCITAFTGVLLFIPIIGFIIIVVFGTSEPRW